MQEATTRVPLGDLWRGACTAGSIPYRPEDSVASELCNMGYARGRCERYARGSAGDAIRFLIARDENDLIRVAYVVEQDHHPAAHGTLEYFRSAGAFAGDAGNPMLASQALAYVTSYLRRRPAAA